MSKINRPPISIAKISHLMKKPGRQGRIAVVVGTVTDDQRIFEIPKNLKVSIMLEPFLMLKIFSYKMLLFNFRYVL